MNIFYLDRNMASCAVYHCDKHVVKMIIEYAQLMSTAHHVLDGENAVTGIYKKTHVNHPSAIWTRASVLNYDTVFNLWTNLLEEYTHRYGKEHKSGLLRSQLNLPPIEIKWEKSTMDFPLCMPDEYKVQGDPVESYRNYYRHGKTKLHSWTKRNVPEWL